MICKGVIFDLDGTLADTLADIAGSMNRVLQKNGFTPHPVPVYKNLIGKGLENLVTMSIRQEHRDKMIIASCLAGFIEDYKVNCLNETRLYEGIESLLASLSEKQVKLGIYSNKADDLTQTIVRSLLPDFRFEMVVGARPDLPRKPDPAGALVISKKMDLLPVNILYVGDSDVDMMAARAAGMFAVGVLWGFRSRKELLDNGAAVLLNKPGELLELTEWDFRGQN